MSTWRITYLADAVGDTPLQRTADVEIDTEGLDVYGEDEQLVLEKLKAALADREGGAQLTDAKQI